MDKDKLAHPKSGSALQMIIALSLILCLSSINADILCPPAVVGFPYSIIYEVHHNRYDLNVTFYRGNDIVANCSITKCEYPKNTFVFGHKTIGTDGVQITLDSASFDTKLEGTYYAVSNVKGVVTTDECDVQQGVTVDECIDFNPCVNATDCTNLISGYKCVCEVGYDGINCTEGDQNIYCSDIGFNIRFSPSLTTCTDISIECYIAGLPYTSPLDINVKQITSNSNTGLMAVATVINQNVTFNVCNSNPPGLYEIIFAFENSKAASDFKFTIKALVDKANTLPQFVSSSKNPEYIIYVLENEPFQSKIVYVNKSVIDTCGSNDKCIEIIDSSPQDRDGIDTLLLVVKLEIVQAAPIAFAQLTDDTSLGYFYISGQLTPGRNISYQLKAYDGSGASTQARVIFIITDVNQPPTCDVNEISVNLDIRTQPEKIIEAVKCSDPDTNDTLKQITYSITGLYASYFRVDTNGTVILYQPVGNLNPGQLGFIVAALGYSEIIDPSYSFYIPFRINITVPELICSLSIKSVPQHWAVYDFIELKLECDNHGVDRLSVSSESYLDLFSFNALKESSTVYKLTLTVITYSPGAYYYEVNATLGAANSTSRVLIQMYNPPIFQQSSSALVVTEVLPVGSLIMTLSATTDIPGSNILYSIKEGNSEHLFSLSSMGSLTLASSARKYVGTTITLLLEAQDSVSSLVAESSIKITIQDKNEPPVCTTPGNLVIGSDVVEKTLLANVDCTDPDMTPAFATLSYNISSDPVTVKLAIDNSGVITLGEVLPFGVRHIQVSVNVSDIGFFRIINFNITVQVISCALDVDKRGIIFPETPVNSQITVNCPYAYTGQVARFCYLNQTWSSYNLTNCKRLDLLSEAQLLAEILAHPSAYTDQNVTDKWKKIANFLALSLESSAPLFSGEIMQIVEIFGYIGKISDIFKKASVDRKALENFGSSLDILIGADLIAWEEALHNNDQHGSILLDAMDHIATASLRDGHITEESPIVKGNIVIKRASTDEDVIFPNNDEQGYENHNGWVQDSQNSAFLPKNAVASTIKYSVILYNNITDKLQINPILQNTSLRSKILSSNILSFTIDETIPSLLYPLELSFLMPEGNNSVPICGFLDTDNNVTGVWSTKGCTTTVQGLRVNCSCNHFTNFALLVSPYGQVSPLHNTVLSIISAVGCGISILCLLATIITYLVLWKYVKCDRSVLHINLCVCLILAYIIFLAGVDRTENVTGCKVVATLLHYIYLAVFCIMLCEGIEIFKSVSFVFSADSILCKLIPISYGVPLIIVAISLGVTRTEGYGSKTSCWLSTDNGLIWAFVGPVLFILLINFIILIHVLRIMQNSKQMVSKTFQQRTRSVVRTVGILSPILGLTWVLGVLSVNEETVVFQYLFAICNSLQGLMIFLCYCLFTHQVKDGFRAMRRKYRAQSYDSGARIMSSTQSGKHSYSDTHNGKNMKGNHSSPATVRTTITQRSTKQKDSYGDSGNFSTTSSSHGHPRKDSMDSSSRDWWKGNGQVPQPIPVFGHRMPLPHMDHGGMNGFLNFSDVYDNNAGLANHAYSHDLTVESTVGNLPGHRKYSRQVEEYTTPAQTRAQLHWNKVREAANFHQAKPSGLNPLHTISAFDDMLASYESRPQAPRPTGSHNFSMATKDARNCHHEPMADYDLGL